MSRSIPPQRDALQMFPEIILASDGQEGLDLALREHFDIVISDIEMPKIDGITLCRRLKDTPATQSIPVVMASIFDNDSNIDKGFQAGAAAYISKHEIKNRLLETVESILSQSRFNRDRLILVVDDSSIVRHIVEKGLAKTGFKVITAEDGKKALALSDTYRPDLIISDIAMPYMNGFDFCEAVQSDPDLAMVPFVVMSAKTDRSYMQRMIQSGASALLYRSEPAQRANQII